MKINQVEELVGISKKNIRFYEDQGLLKPERNPENGYREYTLSDVEQLRRIKLLRQLEVPCEQIRKLTEGTARLDRSMEEQEETLKKRQKGLERMQELCRMMMTEDREFSALKAEEYLEKMKNLEKGGTQFVDVKKTDVKRTGKGAMLAAAVIIVLMLTMIGVMLWGHSQDPLPIAVLIFVILIPAAVIVGTVIALIQRFKELKGGELDEARKY